MSNDVLPNIPRIYTALAEWLACLVIVLPLSKSHHWKVKFCLGGIVQFFLQYLVGTWPLFFWIPGMVINVLWMLIVINLTTKTRKINTYYYVCQAFILAEFAASFTWQLYCNIVLGRYAIDDILSIPFTLTFYVAIYIAFYFIQQKLNHQSVLRQMNKKDILLAALTAIIIFTMSNVGFIMSNTSYPIGDIVSVFLFRSLVNLCGLCILFIQENQKNETFLSGELVAINNMFQSQYEQYNAYRDSSKIIRRQFHDLKHQLEVIRSETDTNKREHYMEEMTTAINTYSATITTGHAVLDTILTSKNSICIDKQITFTCFADGQHLDKIETMDICSLFGNALDNAIESVLKISDYKKRLIDLRIAKKANFLVITVKNITEQNIVFENGIPLTTKDDKNLHGYGLKSIEMISKKYDGNMSVDLQDNWFILKLIIPL